MCGIRVDHIRGITRAIPGSAAEEGNPAEIIRGDKTGPDVQDHGRGLSGNENRAGVDGHIPGREFEENLVFPQRQEPETGW